MKLDPQQVKALREWASNGTTLSESHKRLADTFGLKLTYMDVRFLLDDYDVELTEAPKAPAAQPAAAKPAPKAAMAGPEPQAGEDLEDDEAMDADADLVGGAVKVELDRLTRPGAVISGSVVFSDGVKAQWYLDQYGRLGLDSANKDYRPSPEDIQDFQEELQSLLRKQGF